MDNPVPPTPPISPVPPIPPAPPVLPPAEKSQNWLKISLAIIGALVVLGLFANLYLLARNQKPIAEVTPTPTPIAAASILDETASWKIYENLKYKYQFKYPNDFKITEESADRIYVSNNLPPDPNCEGGGCNLEIPRLSIYFEHLDNPGEDTMSLDDYANARRIGLLFINNDQGEIKKIQKFGLDVRFMEGVTEGYNHNYFIKPNPNLSFSISVIFPSKEDVSKYEDTANLILSTFKFLDQNQATTTVNWEKYSEFLENFGFTLNFKYPNGWKFERNNADCPSGGCGGGGHPNFGTIFSPDKNSCVRVSVSSEPKTSNMDDVLKNGATNWNASLPDNKIIDSTGLLPIAGGAKMRTVERDGKIFRDGGVSLDKDVRFTDNWVYAYLSSCSMVESDNFELIVGSISVSLK